MKAGLSKKELIDFVKNDLGCKCPEEVFSHIELFRDVVIGSEISLKCLLNVGGRLLVIILDGKKHNFIGSSLDKIVSFGRTKRDSEGFNRLRIAVIDGEEQYFRKIWKELQGISEHVDNRVHFHWIPHEKNRLLFIS